MKKIFPIVTLILNGFQSELYLPDLEVIKENAPIETLTISKNSQNHLS